MITVRKSSDRFLSDFGWLHSQHSFSFGDHYDPRAMGFRNLRVINEDRVAEGGGFPTHPHRDMEIISYVLDGALEHRDSMGNGSVIRPGDVQRMTAGTGVRHSEKNASTTSGVHFLQLWLLPKAQGLTPSYEQKTFPRTFGAGQLTLVGARDGRGGAVHLNADADLYAAQLDAGQAVTHALAQGRSAWVQVISGAVEVNGTALSAGDGAAVSDVTSLTLASKARSELLLFDLD
ncbi:MAG: pirin family protein [Myxococcaceae bacterium]|nr:pirin family protein [Myxococcaceae bacterium]